MTPDEAVIAVGADVLPGMLCLVAAVPRQLDHSCTPVHEAPLSMPSWGDRGREQNKRKVTSYDRVDSCFA